MQAPELIYFHEPGREAEVVRPNCDISDYNVYISLHITILKKLQLSKISLRPWLLFWG